MALTRVLIVSNPMSNFCDKLSKPLFSILVVFTLTILGFGLNAPYMYPFILEKKRWKPVKKCGYPKDTKIFEYSFAPPLWLTGTTFLSVLQFVDGVLKFLPLLALPVLTFLLVRVMKKAEANRRKLQRNSESSKDHTTKLIIALTVCLWIAEGPFGLFYILHSFTENEGISVMVTNMKIIWNIL
ncbi:unnamed protein product [Caenorhabditis brenneri]